MPELKTATEAEIQDVLSAPDVQFDSATRGSVYYLGVPYEPLANDPRLEPLRYAFELAMAREPVRDADGDLSEYHARPIYYGSTWGFLNNASEGAGANVLFEEEGRGVDGQILYKPIPNYQIVFSFSYVKREVVGNGFTLVDPIAQTDGVNYGTEYDIWVYLLGPENFTDPKRPSTYTGGSVKGLDLNPAPSTSLRFWNKYTFQEGFLEGLALGGGVQWNSTYATSTPVGGTDLAANRYPTPDLPSHYEIELMASYSTEWKGIDWRFQFNVKNLLDDSYDAPVAEYTNFYGATIYRRAEKFYDPRRVRFSVSARF